MICAAVSLESSSPFTVENSWAATAGATVVGVAVFAIVVAASTASGATAGAGTDDDADAGSFFKLSNLSTASVWFLLPP